MCNKNSKFFNELKRLDFMKVKSKIFLGDARNTSIKTKSINTVITSPPYVTSYEYADLHQLTGFWYDYITNLLEFRKDFIGTFFSYGEDLSCKSSLGKETVDKLVKKDLRTAKEVAKI
jgi:tRNA G10  N-methylase Trm11